MNHKSLTERFLDLIVKIKSHPFYTSLGVIFLICFLIFAYTHPLNTPEENNTRSVLPVVNTPTGAFSLITEPETGMTPILTLIKNATSSIDLVMYEFKDKTIADALLDAEKRGVVVQVLLNQGYFGKEETLNEVAYAYLKSKNIDVRWTPSIFALTHQKTLIVDKNKALIMTFNFAPEYYATARDFAILDIDQNDVTAIENTFTGDWNNENISAQDGDDLVWSPGSEGNLLLILSSAKKELDVYNEEMADSTITNALIAAEKRGVIVNVVMTYQSADKNSFAELKNAGVNLHLFHGEKFYIHAKMILADDDYAFLGSENFSYTSLNQNRELGIFLSDPAIINSLYETFYTDFNNAKEY